MHVYECVFLCLYAYEVCAIECILMLYVRACVCAYVCINASMCVSASVYESMHAGIYMGASACLCMRVDRAGYKKR